MQIAAMRLRLIALLASFWVAAPAYAVAGQGSGTPAPAAARLSGLDNAEAARLIGILQEAQRRLRMGEQLFFDLLSGAPASYRETEISPRRAFLDMAFENALIIERHQSRNRLRQPYRLTISRAWGEVYWDVEVVLGFEGNIERVEMVFRPPPPF
jgi:hypothetical protein